MIMRYLCLVCLIISMLVSLLAGCRSIHVGGSGEIGGVHGGGGVSIPVK
jgi:hypothetical protein